MLNAIGRLRWRRHHIADHTSGDPSDTAHIRTAVGDRDANAVSGCKRIPNGAIAGPHSNHCCPICYYPKISPDTDRYT